MCDAGHEAGRPCGRPAAISVGRVSICAEHLDVLRSGIEAEAVSQSVYFAERYLSENHSEATEWMRPRLEALATEARQESEATNGDLRQFLERAGDHADDTPQAKEGE